ncbi:hypothetical protein V8G54_036117 [Vigna mungo]|uniref:Uncharacterized protein n=1 Tax=Vigna mungo TaxID=3915 RepID=A0AAQ3RC81_VIGMU
MAATSTSSTNGFFTLRSTNNSENGGESKVRGCGKPDGVAMWFINGVTTAFFASLEHCCIRIATQEDVDEANDDMPLILNDGNLRHRPAAATTTGKRKVSIQNDNIISATSARRIASASDSWTMNPVKFLCYLLDIKMPKVKTNRVKYPEGWELIEPTLRELQAKMREAENDPHDGKRKCETLWPIFKIAHQKSRYIFDLYHRRKEISKELYEFCLDQGYADRNLIAKWKKPGYERLCCLRCMQPRDHNFATTCVCRVPKQLREEKVIECVHCGCKGCASGD